MPTSWLISWRRSLACKTQPADVHDPQSLNVDSNASASSRAKVSDSATVFVNTRRLHMRSGCSRSIANLRDVIHSSRRMDSARVPTAMPNVSPKSVESNDFVQSISQEAMFLQEQACDLLPHFKHTENNQHQRQPSFHGKLSLDDIVATHHPNPFNHQHLRSHGSPAHAHVTTGSFYGTPLHPSAHLSAPSAHPALHSHGGTGKGSNSFRKLSGCYDCKNPAVSLVVYKTSAAASSPDASGERGSANGKSPGSALPPVAPKAVCQRCGDAFPKYEALEQHHLLKHAVAGLEVGDSSRNVVEIIFQTSWLRPPEPAPTGAAPSTSAWGSKVQIERVLKVNNLARTLARFEDYREGVKMRASKLPKKHPRCLADGNELLRFYGARLECELVYQDANDGHIESNGTAGSSKAGVCSSASCIICKIIRSGFPKHRGPDGATNRGIVTTATSGRAHQLMVENACAGNGIRECMTTRMIPECGSFQEMNIMPDIAERAARMVNIGTKDDQRIGSTRSDNHTGSLLAMLVCRVIAGRVHKPPQSTTTAPPTPPHSGDLGAPGSGFDSIAGGDTWASGLPPPGMGLHSRFEELTVFNPRAILPCFVVLYRC